MVGADAPAHQVAEVGRLADAGLADQEQWAGPIVIILLAADETIHFRVQPLAAAELIGGSRDIGREVTDCGVHAHPSQRA